MPGSAASSTSRTKPADSTSGHRAVCQQPLMGDCDVRMPKVAKAGLAAGQLHALQQGSAALRRGFQASPVPWQSAPLEALSWHEMAPS